MKKKRYSATGRQVKPDRPLSNVAMNYEPSGFVAEIVAPVVSVPKQSDFYWIWSAADAFRVEDAYRAPGTEANRISRDSSSETFFCKNYAMKDDIPYEDLENAEPGYVITERNSRAKYLKMKQMLSMEHRLASKVTSGTNVGSYSGVSSAWTDHTNSTPIVDINSAINVVEDTTGYRPNRLLFSGTAWRDFKENASVIARLYGSAGAGKPARIVTKADAAAIFEVDQVIVAGAYQNTADKGLTKSLSRLWGANCLAYFAPQRPSKEEPSFMYAFRWKKLAGLSMQARVLADDKRQSEEVEVGMYQDEKITGADLGFLITGVDSST